MTVTIEQIKDAKAYIGTLKNKAHPKTQQYWLDVVNGLVVLNPEMIKTQLENAKQKIQDAKKDKKDILVICEKAMYTQELESLAKAGGFHYLNHKVPAGFLTNFETLQKRIQSMNELTAFMDTDDFHRLTKKEQLSYKRKLQKAEKIYKGVKNLHNKPDLLIVVDGALMDSLIKEVQVAGIDAIVLSSSDFTKYRDPEFLVMSNMNSYKSLDFIMNYILS